MKYLTILLALLAGCTMPKPRLWMYGESDYVYTRVGLSWGTPTKDDLEIEDVIDGDSGSGGSGGGGGCSGGKCSD